MNMTLLGGAEASYIDLDVFNQHNVQPFPDGNLASSPPFISYSESRPILDQCEPRDPPFGTGSYPDFESRTDLEKGIKHGKQI